MDMSTSAELDGGKGGSDSAPASIHTPAVDSPQADVFPGTGGSSAPVTPTTSAFRPGDQRPHAHRMSRQQATETSLNTAYLGAVIPPSTPYRTLGLYRYIDLQDYPHK